MAGPKRTLVKTIEMDVATGGELLGGSIACGYTLGKDGAHVGLSSAETSVKSGKYSSESRDETAVSHG